MPPDPSHAPRRAPGRTSDQARPAGRAPGASTLHNAALAHLARFSATEAGLLRVLVGRVTRWARRALEEGQDPDSVAAAAATAQAAAAEVVQALARAGAVDDGAFARARSARLTRAGRSSRATLAHLAAKGVPQALAQAVLPAPGQEFAAALAHARRRRVGPFAARPAADVEAEPARDDRLAEARALAAMARAGFGGEVARRALATPRAEAEAILARLRQGLAVDDDDAAPFGSQE